MKNKLDTNWKIMIILLYDLWTHLFYHETQGQVRAERSKSRCQTTGTCWWQRSCQNGTGVVVVCLASECLCCAQVLSDPERGRDVMLWPRPVSTCLCSIAGDRFLSIPHTFESLPSFFQSILSSLRKSYPKWAPLSQDGDSLGRLWEALASNSAALLKMLLMSSDPQQNLELRTWVVLLERRVDTASQHLGEQE